jgi:hypothetical protein
MIENSSYVVKCMIALALGTFKHVFAWPDYHIFKQNQCPQIKGKLYFHLVHQYKSYSIRKTFSSNNCCYQNPKFAGLNNEILNPTLTTIDLKNDLFGVLVFK